MDSDTSADSPNHNDKNRSASYPHSPSEAFAINFICKLAYILQRHCEPSDNSNVISFATLNGGQLQLLFVVWCLVGAALEVGYGCFP